MMMVPTIADAIISAGGAGVMTKAKAAAGKTASATRSTGKTIGSAATRVGTAMAGKAGAVATAIGRAMRGK